MAQPGHDLDHGERVARDRWCQVRLLRRYQHLPHAVGVLQIAGVLEGARRSGTVRRIAGRALWNAGPLSRIGPDKVRQCGPSTVERIQPLTRPSPYARGYAVARPCSFRSSPSAQRPLSQGEGQGEGSFPQFDTPSGPKVSALCAFAGPALPAFTFTRATRHKGRRRRPRSKGSIGDKGTG